MLALLTLSFASAEQASADGTILAPDADTTSSRTALIEAATTCCITEAPTIPAGEVVPLQRLDILRMSLGHTRRGGIDYIGGTGLTEQLVAFDGLPMMIDSKHSVFYQRTGTMALRPNADLNPRAIPLRSW